MYYEEAEVKQYFRKDRKGNKKPYYQIGIKKKSKFNKAGKIALVDIYELESLLEGIDSDKINETNTKLKSTSQELIQLKKDFDELKLDNESLMLNLEKISSEKEIVQENLLIEKDKLKEKTDDVVEVKDKLIKLQEEHKKEVKELHSKLEVASNKIEKLLIIINNKDNDIVFLAKRGLGSRIRNKLTERIKATLEDMDSEE